MAKNLYIIATEARSGKSAICLGVMQLLLKQFQRVAFFRPIITGGPQGKKDHDINLVLSQYYLNQRYEDTYVYTLDQARDMINQGKHTIILETILAKFKELEARYDFVLCEGTDFMGTDSAFEFDINAEIASNLGCPVILVANGHDKEPEKLVSATQIAIDTFAEKNLDIFATIVNRVDPGFEQKILEGLTCKYIGGQDCLTYAIPEDPTLGKPTVGDVAKWLNAQVLYGQDQLDTPIDDYIVAAMQVGNFLDYIRKGALVITPGDRADVVLGCYASRLSTAYQDVTGIVLTGGLDPHQNIKKLIEGWTGVPLPVLLAEGHTYKVARILMDLYGRIEADDQKKIATALGTFEAHVKGDDFLARLGAKRSTKITPKMFEYSLIDKAKHQKQHIVLPEGTSGRILRAADWLLRRGVADITILGKENEVHPLISQLGLDLSGAQIIDPAKSPHYEEYWRAYHEMRKSKGVTEDMARDQMLSPTYFGTMMVQNGHASGMVSGSITTTQETIRPALQIIKTKPGMSIVSSVFFMCLADRVLAFGDCAVNPSPNAQQLAEIAIQSAHTANAFGIEPRIAMLSYSTGASGSGAEVDKVREATKIAHEMAPELKLEGPLQYDAAIDPEVAALKLPGSEVAGKATIFIFPDLNTGNNTYKAVQRAAQAVAIGPVLQGLNKPVNDLSRGCTVEDIVNTVAITAIQAQH
jgi:phosphate acetyltransferase